MNDAKDVSLEADRLEELLEAPVPSQPVVMIEYRNRGVPWWLLATVMALVPAVIGAFAYYQYSVVERYRALASKVEYEILQRSAADQSESPKSNASGATPGPVLAELADVSVLHAVGAANPAAGEPTKAGAAPPADSKNPPKVDLADAAAASPSTEVDQPSRSRVRSITRSPFDSDDQSPVANESGGHPVVSGPMTEPKKTPSEPAGTKLASVPKEARVGEKPTTTTGALAGPSAQGSPATRPTDGAVAKAAGARDIREDPALEPLPNAEEFLSQNVEEAARKEHDLAEQKRASGERARVVMHEERVKFHDELREILAMHGKRSGPEIDELVRRSGKLHDARTFTRARNIWRQLRLSQPAKVAQIRALEIPEPAILNFISDNLYARMRTPGGPRDDNEVRVRAAQILLSYKLSSEKDSPELTSSPSKDLKGRGTDGAGPE
jgi:hypothetical protein